MDKLADISYDVYKDINARTNGEIYLGVVGPVRTGKSTFIKRFMELLVIPNIQDIHNRERAIDEMPQSANGRIIMTTEPKFIPKEAVTISIDESTKFRVRLIDCVGYMVDGAMGHIEEDHERMVHTPWSDVEMPFSKAAEIGTKKVISEHSTIGIIVTTDGSIGEIPREAYIASEERTINELKQINKPFVVLLNSLKPHSNETQMLAKEMENKYRVIVIPVNCDQLKKNDITKIMEKVLSVFPIEQINFYMPKWTEILDSNNNIKKTIISSAQYILSEINTIDDAKRLKSYISLINNQDENVQSELYNIYGDSEEKYIKDIKIDSINIQKGNVKVIFEIEEKYYYQALSNLTGVEINGEYQLVSIIRELAALKNDYEKIAIASKDVKNSGYGIITPDIGEIKIENPEIIKHGGKFGVKIKATAPSTHLLLTNISVEIAPIVGTEEQANDLKVYIQENSKDNSDGIWETNIFGKSIRQLIDEGIYEKVNRMNNETRLKMQDTLQKIINESSGGVICIII